MEPRADFSCRACARSAGEDGLHVHVDLPVGSTRCPIRGTKIQRLFNAVNVGNANARAHAKLIEHSSIPAQMDAKNAQKSNSTISGAALERAGLTPQGALGTVQGSPGATLYSRGGIDHRGEPVLGSIGVIRSLNKPRPMHG